MASELQVLITYRIISIRHTGFHYICHNFAVSELFDEISSVANFSGSHSHTE